MHRSGAESCRKDKGQKWRCDNDVKTTYVFDFNIFVDRNRFLGIWCFHRNNDFI